MRYIVVSIFDKAAAAYSRPFFVAAVGQAMRIFEDEAKRVAEDNPISRHPSDFELYHVGFFDDSVGQFVNVDIAPLRLISGSDVVAPF